MCSASLSFLLYSLSCEAVDHQNSTLHIVYMGSLPTTPSYSPTTHHITMLQQVLGSNASLVWSYTRSFNGFAAVLTSHEREQLSKMEGVVSVFPSKALHTQTTKSWDFIGLSAYMIRGSESESNMVIGVIDTGIWPESQSFRDDNVQSIPKTWKGVCAGGMNFTCNKKIIGARYYDSDSARDNVGHGTHTASIAAGNQVRDVSFYGLAQGVARGGVPSARIAAYKACSHQCSEAYLLAAFDDAIADGVDLISISAGYNSPIQIEVDAIAIGSFHAAISGILTVQSAGNIGPYPASVISVAPWALSVAASTIDRKFVDKVVLGNGETLTGIAINTIPSNGTKFPIIMQQSQELAKGKIILCGHNVSCPYEAYISGSLGVIQAISNHSEDGADSITAVSAFPFVKLYPHEYAVVEAYAASPENPRAEILSSETAEDHTAPMVAKFSSRGPNSIVPEILKPDISAPGVEILAAYPPNSSPSGIPQDTRFVQYNILSGTSMSCPHAAAVAAFVKSFHLGWSPAAIKSAIMTTARPMNGSTYGDQIGEYAYGSGNVNPAQAIDPGLIYDIHKEDYVQLLCNLGYDNQKIKTIFGETGSCSGARDGSSVSNLNYPILVAVVEPMTSFSAVFNRTVTNVGTATSNYTATVLPNPRIIVKVEPETLSFKSLNENKSFVVSIIGEKLPKGTVLISSLVWSDGIHNVRSPIVVNVSS